MLMKKENYDAIMREYRASLAKSLAKKGIKIHTNGFRKVCPTCGGRKVREAKRCRNCRMLDPSVYDSNNRWKCD